MTEALTAFDAVAITLVIISALMAVARGFVRELATLGAFIAALAAAYYARSYLRNPLSAFLPENTPSWTADFILIVTFFLAVYIAVAVLGHRLSQNVQSVEGIGTIDRLAGLVFGIARGAVAIVFFVYVLQLGLEQDRIPEWIADARTYPLFASAADYVHANAPRIAEDVSDAAGQTRFTTPPN
ncbi:MAG: CvpA family protein [Pseudomonadota bacterium]